MRLQQANGRLLGEKGMSFFGKWQGSANRVVGTPLPGIQVSYVTDNSPKNHQSPPPHGRGRSDEAPSGFVKSSARPTQSFPRPTKPAIDDGGDGDYDDAKHAVNQQLFSSPRKK